jgi:hypothetical protein
VTFHFIGGKVLVAESVDRTDKNWLIWRNELSKQQQIIPQVAFVWLNGAEYGRLIDPDDACHSIVSPLDWMIRMRLNSSTR